MSNPKCKKCNHELSKSFDYNADYECILCGRKYTTKKENQDDDIVGDVIGLGLGLLLGGLGGDSSSDSDSSSSDDFSGGGGDSAGGGASGDW